jgi:hypothetical protein
MPVVGDMSMRVVNGQGRATGPAWAVGVALILFTLFSHTPNVVEVIQALKGTPPPCSPLDLAN